MKSKSSALLAVMFIVGTFGLSQGSHPKSEMDNWDAHPWDVGWGPPGMVDMQEKDGPPDEDAYRNRMGAISIWKMTEELKLTEEQAEKFFPRHREHREKIQAIHKKQKEAMWTLREKVDRGDEVSNDEINKMLKLFTKLEKQKIDYRTAYLIDMEDILNNAQRVKLVMFKDDFQRELQQRVRRHMKSRAPRDMKEMDMRKKGKKWRR